MPANYKITRTQNFGSSNSSSLRKKTALRWLWQLRYRLYAFLVIAILVPILYASNQNIPQSVEALGYEVLENNLLAEKIRRKPIVRPKIPKPATTAANNSAANPGTSNSNNSAPTKEESKNGVVLVDTTGDELTQRLKDAKYDLGYISPRPFVDLGLGLPVEEKQEEKPEEEVKDRPKSLDELVPVPETASRVNFLRYPKYNINAPIIYSGFEDLFEATEGCDVATEGNKCLDFTKARDLADVNSPVQKKLQEGVVHLAFTPHPGELGNSYIVGHSSNYSWIKSNYNQVFSPLEGNSNQGEEFFIYDRYGRELKFRVFDALKIAERDTEEAYRNYPDRRVVTLQTSVLGWDPTINAIGPTHRWLTRAELVLE